MRRFGFSLVLPDLGKNYRWFSVIHKSCDTQSATHLKLLYQMPKQMIYKDKFSKKLFDFVNAETFLKNLIKYVN